MNDQKSIIDLAKEATRPPETTQAPSSEPARKVNPKNDPHGASIDAALKDLLSNVESKKGWISVNLPSNGFAGYPKTVEVRAFTFEDEKVLRNVKNIKDGEAVISNLISRCVKGVNVQDITVFDKTFLLFKLRELSYGDTYTIEGNCGSCSEKNELVVTLSELGVIYTEQELEKNITLPDSQVVVKMRPVLCKDETLFKKASDIMDNLWRFVVSVGGHTERMIIQKFITQTTAKDISVIRESIMDEKSGLDMKVRFLCNSCGSEEDTLLPLNDHFFSVSSPQD